MVCKLKEEAEQQIVKRLDWSDMIEGILWSTQPLRCTIHHWKIKGKFEAFLKFEEAAGISFKTPSLHFSEVYLEWISGVAFCYLVMSRILGMRYFV